MAPRKRSLPSEALPQQWPVVTTPAFRFNSVPVISPPKLQNSITEPFCERRLNSRRQNSIWKFSQLLLHPPAVRRRSESSFHWTSRRSRKDVNATCLLSYGQRKYTKAIATQAVYRLGGWEVRVAKVWMSAWMMQGVVFTTRIRRLIVLKGRGRESGELTARCSVFLCFKKYSQDQSVVSHVQPALMPASTAPMFTSLLKVDCFRFVQRPFHHHLELPCLFQRKVPTRVWFQLMNLRLRLRLRLCLTMHGLIR